MTDSAITVARLHDLATWFHNKRLGPMPEYFGERTAKDAADQIERFEKALRWIKNNPGAHRANILAVVDEALT